MLAEGAIGLHASDVAPHFGPRRSLWELVAGPSRMCVVGYELCRVSRREALLVDIVQWQFALEHTLGAAQQPRFC